MRILKHATAALVGLLFTGVSVSAATITTIGIFSAPAPAIIGGGGSTVQVGTTTLAFTGVTNQTLPPASAPILLGFFTLTDPTGSPSDTFSAAANVNFLLEFDQNPGVGTPFPNAPANVRGTANVVSATAIQVDFFSNGIAANPAVTIGNATYVLQDAFLTFVPFSGGFQTALYLAPAGGQVVTPLPAAAWGGIGLFGLVAGQRLRRRMMDA